MQERIVKSQAPSPSLGFGRLFAATLCAMGILEYDNSTPPAPPDGTESPAVVSTSASAAYWPLAHALEPVPPIPTTDAPTRPASVEANVLLEPGVLSRPECRVDAC